MPAGTEMTAIGDSVMLGSATAVQQRFPGIIIDAKVSRFLHEGPGVITSLKAKGLLRKYIVIGLSTNGAGTPQQWENIYNAAGPGHVFLVVNAHMDRVWAAAANQNVRDFVSRHPQDALWSTGMRLLRLTPGFWQAMGYMLLLRKAEACTPRLFMIPSWNGCRPAASKLSKVSNLGWQQRSCCTADREAVRFRCVCFPGRNGLSAAFILTVRYEFF